MRFHFRGYWPFFHAPVLFPDGTSSFLPPPPSVTFLHFPPSFKNLLRLNELTPHPKSPPVWNPLMFGFASDYTRFSVFPMFRCCQSVGTFPFYLLLFSFSFFFVFWRREIWVMVWCLLRSFPPPLFPSRVTRLQASPQPTSLHSFFVGV